MAIDILQQRMSMNHSLKRSLLALLYMSSNVIRIIKESPPTLCSIDSSCCVGKFATGRHSLVKNSAGQSKRLNLGDVLVTRNRLCTGLSPGIGDSGKSRGMLGGHP